MSTSRSVAFWLFVYLAASPLLSSVLVLAGRAPSYPVFQTFESAPAMWRIAFFVSGLLAALSAYLVRRNKRAAIPVSIVFLATFVSSFRVVWGQIAFGIWIAVVATALTIFITIKNRNEV